MMRRMTSAATDLEKALQSSGPTGEYPNGKLAPCDQGGVTFTLAHGDGRVIIMYKDPVQYIGFTPDQADALADGLRDMARAAREPTAPGELPPEREG